MKTKSVNLKVMTIALLSAGLPFTTKAQDKVEASVGADIVSNYIWRGTDCGGVSIQPSMSVGYKGLSLSAWGSVGIDKDDAREIDLTLGYTTGGFSVAITDYWFAYRKEDGGYTGDYFKYGAYSTPHIFEATLGYDFGPLAISWNTYFAGADYVKADGDRAYSTYVGISAPFKLGGLDWSAEVGFTPWEGAYADKFNVTNLTLKAEKEIKFTDSFSLPAFAQLTFNPHTQGTYFAFGLSF